MSSSFEEEQEYLAQTNKLRRQLAGLELVVSIRKCIECELMERRWKGNYYTDELKFNFRDGATTLVFRSGELNYQLGVNAKGMDEKVAMLQEILEPHVQAGDIPPCTVEKTVLQGQTCIQLRCPVSI